MSRFPFPDPATLPEANRAAFENPAWGDLAKHMACLGDAFQPLTDLWIAFYYKGFLPAQTRQIVLNRTAYLCGCDYELKGEKQPSLEAGLTEERYQAIFGSLPSPLFTDAENVAAMIADELVGKVKADPALVGRALQLMDANQVRELILVIGMYMLYGRFCANLEIERQ